MKIMSDMEAFFLKAGLCFACIVIIALFITLSKNKHELIEFRTNPPVKIDTVKVDNKIYVHDTVYRYHYIKPVTEEPKDAPVIVTEE